MSGGYKTPAKDDADAIKRHLEGQSDAITILQRLSGDQLANVVAKITALVTNLIVPAVSSGASGTYTLTTSYAAITSCVLTVPAGCTRALVQASGTVSVIPNTAGPDTAFAQVVIAGVGGQEAALPLVASGGFAISGAVAAVATASLTGLIAGGSVIVLIQAHMLTHSGLATPYPATVTAMGMFLP
jgi:hypothetical protein